jgi:hypothetical protein
MRSSAFRLSTITVSRSLASTRFSSESAPGPCMGLIWSRSLRRVVHLFPFISFVVGFESSFFVPSRASLTWQFRARPHACCDRNGDQRGARLRARSIAPQPCIRWVWGPNHDAVMRIGSEAPKRRTHSSSRHESQGALPGFPPPRTVIGVPSQANGQGRNC